MLLPNCWLLAIFKLICLHFMNFKIRLLKNIPPWLAEFLSCKFRFTTRFRTYINDVKIFVTQILIESSQKLSGGFAAISCTTPYTRKPRLLISDLTFQYSALKRLWSAWKLTLLIRSFPLYLWPLLTQYFTITTLFCITLKPEL